MPIESVVKPLTGDFTLVSRDPNGMVPETTILRATDEWAVDVSWNISGAAAEFVDQSKMWTVTLFLESMGTGFEGPVGKLQVPAMGGLVQEYGPHTITIAANLALAEGNTSRTYKLVGVLTLAQGTTPLPIAGYHEGPILQFYLP